MKFDNNNYKDYDVIKSDTFYNCVECGHLTLYLEEASNFPTCSTECLDEYNDFKSKLTK